MSDEDMPKEAINRTYGDDETTGPKMRMWKIIMMMKSGAAARMQNDARGNRFLGELDKSVDCVKICLVFEDRVGRDAFVLVVRSLVTIDINANCADSAENGTDKQSAKIYRYRNGG